jgi:thiamine kinase-like enzyme
MHQDVVDQLTKDQAVALMPEMDGHNIAISVLKGGITNKLYRVEDEQGGDYVFRLYGPKTEMFIDRAAEMETMKVFEPFHISPKLVKYLPDNSVTIIEFIDAYTLKNRDFLEEKLWETIVRPIKIVHKSGISISNVFEPIVEVKRLQKILNGIKTGYTEFDIKGTINILEKIYDRASITRDNFVLCHNDLLADNFMLVKNRKRYPERMYLIDWEYAGMNTCYYELADMFQEILVSRDIEKQLLEIYWDNKDMEHNVYMTELFKPFPDIYWFFWSLIQLNISKIEFDYYNYGKVKYENAEENIRYLRENYSFRI